MLILPPKDEVVREAARRLNLVIPALPPKGNPSALFVTRAKVADKLTYLGSGFRRNDARDAIFEVRLIPKRKN